MLGQYTVVASLTRALIDAQCPVPTAWVAKPVDAPDSKSGMGNHVRVRVSPQAPFPTFHHVSNRSRNSHNSLFVIFFITKPSLDTFPGVAHNPTKIVVTSVGTNTGTLTAATVRTMSSPGRYADGNTLFLNVKKSGSKSWVQRVSVDGRRRDIGLGSYPTVSLAKARRLAMANRRPNHPFRRHSHHPKPHHQ